MKITIEDIINELTSMGFTNPLGPVQEEDRSAVAFGVIPESDLPGININLNSAMLTVTSVIRIVGPGVREIMFACNDVENTVPAVRCFLMDVDSVRKMTGNPDCRELYAVIEVSYFLFEDSKYDLQTVLHAMISILVRSKELFDHSMYELSHALKSSGPDQTMNPMPKKKIVS